MGFKEIVKETSAVTVMKQELGADKQKTGKKRGVQRGIEAFYCLGRRNFISYC